MKRPRLVPDWRECWRWYTMHTAFIGLVLTSAAGSVVLASGAVQFREVFDSGIVLLIAAGIFLLNMVGRLLLQSTRNPRDDGTPSTSGKVDP